MMKTDRKIDTDSKIIRKLNIGIIGGGLSGLIAAYDLQKQFKNHGKVTILEKELQLGGRIFSKKFLDCSIELGAQFFIHNGVVHNLLKSLNLESEIIPLKNNFISFYYNKKVIPRDDISKISLFKSEKGYQEMQKLLKYAKKITFSEDLIVPSFEEWYRKNIGEHLLLFWNRMLISIGVRDVQSINAYFGLILVNVFFGDNYLLKTGLINLINKLKEQIIFDGGEIITGAKCTSLEVIEKKFRVKFQKNDMIKKIIFHKIISTVPPTDLIEFCKLDELIPLKKIDSHPMTLYVITSSDKLWNNTWGLVVCDENSPIYALCDWRNITQASKYTPILVICSPLSKPDEIISELKRLFPGKKINYKIIFEKKWSIGLHQSNEEFFKIPKTVNNKLPSNFYLAGDWTVLPSLEGAIVSGSKVAKLILKMI